MYIENLNRIYQTGKGTEHSYRAVLSELFQGKELTVVNEPKRITDVGAPDYIVMKKGNPLGYIEVKDIGKNLEDKEYFNQFDRYKKAFGNLIISNYLDFRLYREGQLVKEVNVGNLVDGKIIGRDLQGLYQIFDEFITYKNFIIKEVDKLAEVMADKAKLLKEVLEKILIKDIDRSLQEQLEVFKKTIIKNIDERSFADIYAQTIVYGMFVARIHDSKTKDFDKIKASRLIPKTNPFLRGLFNYISGADCDDRLEWIIDSIVELFKNTDMESILNTFRGQDDPIIHFYETFLSKYDKDVRKNKGVYYTPQEAVRFIVKSCDDILKTEFNISDGLIDESKVNNIHKVQILDPATGTGTFLVETIKHIKDNFIGGDWNKYVDEHLINRLNGFEVLMASYVIAHLKLDLILMETGYKPNKRFNIYLTNSLERYHDIYGSLFSSYISNESKEADKVKKDKPIMVVIGNPPYSKSSTNKGKWIKELIEEYKQDLNEKKINLDDDYIKFIRYGQYHIEKNGEGVLAYVTNNSFLDGATHRQMRKSLLKSFDKIYILNLHGNVRRKVNSNEDENIFAIQQGVSINIFIKKKGLGKDLADVYYSELIGSKESKLDFLKNNDIKDITWHKLKYKEPYYFFVPKDFTSQEEYQKGFKITDLMKTYVNGIQTVRDKITIQYTEDDLKEVLVDFENLKEDELKIKYNTKDGRDWKVCRAKKDVINKQGKILDISYRPFDDRKTYYSGQQNGFICNGRYKIMRNMLQDNICLLLCKRKTTEKFNHVFITDKIYESSNMSNKTSESSYGFPLYIYPENNVLDKKRLNLNKSIMSKFGNIKNPIDVIDYIYAILHHEGYRQKHHDFLMVDFPRIPYPKDNFDRLVSLGRQLRDLHLMRGEGLDDFTIKIQGKDNWIIDSSLKYDIISNIVKIYINNEISISNIPLEAWNSYVGIYQPCLKWLKDRIGRQLTRRDIKHYNHMINALVKAKKVIKNICKEKF